MQGRIKRRLAQQQIDDRSRREAHGELPRCALCSRPLGAHVEWHHPVPKSKGGSETVPVHPICHRAIHAHVSNHDLATLYQHLDDLRTQPGIERFLRWIRNKPADFHAPTTRSRHTS